MPLRKCLPVLLPLVMVGCSSEDPRLPKQIHEEALKLSLEGKTLEAKVLLEQLAERFPDSEYRKLAQQDANRIDWILKDDLKKRLDARKKSLERVMNALTRYRNKQGEFPDRLANLVPEYLEKLPESPWGHPYLYRPYVTTPRVDVKVRGNVTQRFNTKFDGYYLACLGTDAAPGGEGLTADVLVRDGAFVDMARNKAFPAPPELAFQPFR